MMKKLLSLLLCAVMLLGMAATAAPAYAVEPEPTLTVTGGKSFSGATDQLAMEKRLDEIPLSFETTITVPEEYAASDKRGGIIVSNYVTGVGGASFDSTREYVDIEVYTSGHPALYWQESNASSSLRKTMSIVFDEVNVATGEFVHLAITYDPTSNEAKCYVNGELKQTIVNNNLEPKVPDGYFKVGGDYRHENKLTTNADYNAQYFKGTIANLSMWSCILTADDVAAHYAALCADISAVPSGDVSGLMGSWDMTAPDANGDYADKSLNGNDVYVAPDWIDIDFAEGDYTMVVMPDPQVMVMNSPEHFYIVTDWIADNVNAMNIKGVLGVGDMVNNNNEAQWTASRTGMDMIDDTGVPWMPMRGNHDNSAGFNETYGYDEFSQKPYFGGAYEEGKLDYTYWFINAGEREYMVLSLGWAPSWDVLDWAEELVQAYPEKNVIITAHAYMYWDYSLIVEGDDSCVNSYSGFNDYPEGQDIWDRLSQYENVVLGLGGHIGASDLITYVDQNGADKDVLNVLVDSQNLDYNGGNVGLLCLLTFHEDSDTVDVNWYSPIRDAFFRERNQFSTTVPHVEVVPGSVNKGELRREVLNSGNYRPLNYTAETWAPFNEALTTAKAVIDDDAATQEQVNAARTALVAARAALVERQGLAFSAADWNYVEFSESMVIPETVEVWFQIPENYGKRALLGAGFGAVGGQDSKTEVYWGIDWYGNGNLYWWEEGQGHELVKPITGLKANSGEWMLLSIVRDQENKCVYAYVNGELFHTITDLTGSKNTCTNVLEYTTGLTTTKPMRLGRDWRTTTRVDYEGSIGELRVYRDDRTAAEIKAGYLNDIKGEALRDNSYLADADLTGCWRLRDLTDEEAHPYTFNNLATGAAAISTMTISTVGFASARDTSALEDEIAAVKAMDKSNYTNASWNVVAAKITAAEAVVADPSTQQADVVAALKDLRDAVDALVEYQGLTFSASAKNYAEFSKSMKIPETVELWFQIPEGYTERGMLGAGFGAVGGANSSTEVYWGLDFYNKNGKKLCWWEEADGYELSSHLVDVEVDTGAWILLSIVRDQENECIYAYVNGELAYTVEDLSSTATSKACDNVLDYTTGATTTKPMRLGTDYRTSKTPYFEGGIGELRVYQDDRTAAEIKAGYLNDIKGDQRDNSYLADADLTGCWRLRELTDEEAHAYTFANLATGAAADSAMTISTVGFTSARDTSALEAEIAAAEALTEADYTVTTWTALETEITAAKAVVADTTNKQADVAAALVDLRAAVAALVEAGDKTDLQAAVDAAKALTKDDYTTATWAAVAAAVEAAEDVLDDGDALQAAVDAAEEALAAAVTALVERGDKTALQAAVDAAKALTKDDYTTATWAAVAAAVADAEDVLDDVDALQPAIDAAKETVADAVAALVERGDKSALQAAVDAAKALVTADYTTATWAAVAAAVADAEDVLADVDALQPAIDAAKEALDAAVTALVERGDKSALQAAVDAAKALTKDDYTTATWAAVTAAVGTAEEVLSETDALQDDIDAAKKAVDDAVAALVKRGDKTALQKAVADAKALTEDDYTTATWAAAAEAVKAADAVLADVDALQGAIDAAKKAVDDAVAALVKRHNLVKVEAKDATYTAAGNKEYYYCDTCKAVFADAEGTKELNESEIKALVIPQLIKVNEEKAEVSEGAVDKAIEDAKEKAEVTLDLTHKDVVGEENVDAITKADLPVAGLETVAKADKNLILMKEDATVTLDAKALDAVAEQAEGDSVTMKVENIHVKELTQKQQTAVKDKAVAATISVELICNKTGKNIATKDGKGFGDGTATVVVPVPAKLPDGVKAIDLKVYFVDDDGTVSEVKSELKDGNIIFRLKHFSEYVIAAEKPASPTTGDNMNVTLYSALAIMAVLGMAVVLKKKAF